MKLKFKKEEYGWTAKGKSKNLEIFYTISVFIHGINNYKLTCKHKDGKEDFWQYVWKKSAFEDAQLHWDYFLKGGKRPDET